MNQELACRFMTVSLLFLVEGHFVQNLSPAKNSGPMLLNAI